MDKRINYIAELVRDIEGEIYEKGLVDKLESYPKLIEALMLLDGM